jgi:furry protein family
MSFDIMGVLQWVHAVFNSSTDRVHRIGRRALRNVLSDNLDQNMVMDETLAMCYLSPAEDKTNSPNDKCTQSYFNVVADLIIDNENTGYKIYQIFALSQYRLGHPSVEIRDKAFKLLMISEERMFGRSCIQPFESGVLSQTVAVYKKAQYMLVRTLTREYFNHAMLVFSELCGFFGQMKESQRREVVTIMLPWISIMELQNELNDAELSAAAYMVLVNLFEMTVKYSDKLQTEVEALWSALASATSHNVRTILKFFMQQSIEQRNPSFVMYARQIVVYLGRSPEGTKLYEVLLVAMEPRAWKWRETSASLVPDFVDFPHAAVLSELLPAQSKLVSFTTGQLALIFIVDLLAEPATWITAHLPLLLQVVFVQLDSHVNIVYEAAKSLLLNLSLSFLCVMDLEPQVKSKLRAFLDDLRGRDYKSLWSYESNSRNKGTGTRAPGQMEKLVSDVIEVMGEGSDPDLRQSWGKVAMQWATSCPVRHLACRSFQVFRCLSPAMDQEMLASMLVRLSNTISDNSEDREVIQGFSLEVLSTLNSIIRGLDEAQLLAHPQLFWVTIASLHTIHEREFLEVLPMLESVLMKMDLSNPANVETIMAAFPPKWDGRFEGIQPLVLRGLRSSIALPPAMKILDILDSLPIPNELVGGNNRLMFSLLANLPRFLHALDNLPLPEEVVARAERLCNLAVQPQQENVRKILTSYAKTRFRTKEDFVRQIIGVLRDAFFPEYEAQGLTFLLGLLTNRLPWMKIKTMVVLKTILPHVNLRKPEFAGIGAEILSPLLRLLQSEYTDQALEVLDETITFVGQPMDRYIARMSLGNRSVKKEYENNVTLFGIPDDSGWAIPAPMVMATTTRSNVHSVFYTCPTIANPLGVSSSAIPEVQFHKEDYTFTGITALEERTDTLLSTDERSDEKASLGDMVSALHSLDVFFTEDVSASTNPGHMNSPSYPDNDFGAIDPSETAPAIYDSRVAGILSRSLARTPSVTSLRTTFAESFNAPGYPRHRTPTSPSFSGFGLSPRTLSRKLHRPGPSNRSISGPSEFDVPESSSSDEDTMDEEDGQSPSRSGGIDESSFQLETLLRQTPAPKSSMRTRFLGGGNKEKESPHGKTDKKPSPRTHLRNAKGPKTQVRSREPEGYPSDMGYEGP